jgi:signal transduction histidine kinase
MNIEDSWDWVEQELKKIQAELPADNNMMQVVDAISVADFWKRRYDEERMLWERKLELKEDEKKGMQEKAMTHEMAIKELDWKLRELENRWNQEKLLLEERLHTREEGINFEASRQEYETRLRGQHITGRPMPGIPEASQAAAFPAQREAFNPQSSRQLKEMEEILQKTEAESRSRLAQLENEKQEVLKAMKEKETVFASERSQWEKLEKEIGSMSGQMNTRLTGLKEREEEHFAILEDLARGFAHRVRNYLGIMSGTIQLSLSNFKMEPDLEEQLKVVDQNVQDMLGSIEEFLQLARVPQMNMKALNVNSLLDNALMAQDSRLKTQNISVLKKYAQDIPELAIDEKLMGGALANLFENAMDAMPQGGQLALTTLYDKEKNLITIKMSDTGIGVGESHIKKIFQPYFTSKKGRKGLGLTAAKRAVDLHRGSLTLESVKDKGATVTISLIPDLGNK